MRDPDDDGLSDDRLDRYVKTIWMPHPRIGKLPDRSSVEIRIEASLVFHREEYDKLIRMKEFWKYYMETKNLKPRSLEVRVARFRCTAAVIAGLIRGVRYVGDSIRAASIPLQLYDPRRKMSYKQLRDLVRGGYVLYPNGKTLSWPYTKSVINSMIEFRWLRYDEMDKLFVFPGSAHLLDLQPKRKSEEYWLGEK